MSSCYKVVVGDTDASSKLRCKGISLLEKAWFSVFGRSPDDFMLHKFDIIQMNLLLEQAAQSEMKNSQRKLNEEGIRKHLET